MNNKGDIQNVGELEVLLKEGAEYVNMLYTFRSIRKSLALADEKNNKGNVVCI